jgi:hypothetical protein
MNRKTIVASLGELANELDLSGLHNEANEITEIMVKVSQADQPWSFKDTSKPRKPDMNENEVVYRVMKRMFGPNYNNMPGLNQKLYQMRQELTDAVRSEAEELGVPVNKAIMRLNESFDRTGKGQQPGRKIPMFKDRGVMGPSGFDPNQDTEEYDPAAPDYDLNTKPMYDIAMNWIKKNGNNNASQAKKDAFDQMKAGLISPELYRVIAEHMDVRIMKTPARKPPMGPYRGSK